MLERLILGPLWNSNKMLKSGGADFLMSYTTLAAGDISVNKIRTDFQKNKKSRTTKFQVDRMINESGDTYIWAFRHSTKVNICAMF